MTVVTLAINFLLSIVVKKLTDFEEHQTKSNFVYYHLLKSVITQFINTSIIYFVSSFIVKSPYLSKEGLATQVSNLFLSSAVIQIILNFVNPSAVWKVLKNWKLYQNKAQIDMFQIDLNK